MRQFIQKVNPWLLPTVLILFILQVITLPFVAAFTYAGRSDSPEHILTYKVGSLQWDSATNIDKNGVAELSLFRAEYDNVESEDGEKVIAPGTQGHNLVRLKNSVSGPVNYYAVLYSIESNPDLPVQVSMSANRALPIGKNYAPIPYGVQSDQVLQCFKGVLNEDRIQDFDIYWDWAFYDDELQDEIDTMLGDAEEEDITVGLYIVVEDNNEYIIPKTGDDSRFGMYLGLLLISGTMLVILLAEERRRRKCEQ